MVAKRVKCKNGHHKWKPRPMWDMFSKDHHQCQKCGYWKCLVDEEYAKGKFRIKWRYGFKF